ncbi:RNA polymerase sigma factor [Posidoniimonas polymericola]|uniref:RNA polymerase sigma factor n=1 Tax=Posidoniimonas polymericola TaxID=2528002 RepID=A0A5C5ZH64_9BACT|nr:sigma-70 family RNA polymerase sigma factor [Posidoniimonas polymericola]TWT85893.1 RNA polymerase sigma factor [Posidoniimonas polymericola]
MGTPHANDANPQDASSGDASSGDKPAPVDEAFIQLLTAEQFRLRRYITVLLGDPDAASNVLQETNVAIWRKSQTFEPGTNFRAWSRKVAYWQVQAYVRDQGRDRLVFTEKLVEQLTNREEAQDPREAEVRLALRHCLASVSKKNRDMLRMRYEDGMPVAKLADSIGKSPSAVKVGLMRIRRALQGCIERQVAENA